MRNAIERGRWFWWAAFAIVAIYVAVRMCVLALWSEVPTPGGSLRLPNTYATVDHPFHVARAATLWRELGSGHVLRWVGQHQGGYPVEFYPLGEAWLEVAIRAVSLGFLPAEGAHTLAVIALFLVPGVAFTWLARIDCLSPVVAMLAFALHLSLPGGWYSGGYTELVQWGLVTNVAGAMASFLMVPALVVYLARGGGWAAALAAGAAALAVYSNPRSLIGIIAIGAGVWVAVGIGHPHARWRVVTTRLLRVGAVGALLAAPELVSLLRFGGLYAFVRYSGYERLADYLQASVAAVTWPVLALAAVGITIGLRGYTPVSGTASALSGTRATPASPLHGRCVGATPVSPARLHPPHGLTTTPTVPERLTTYITSRKTTAVRAVSITLIGYVALTALLVQVPSLAGLAPQLELTRLMPLQRLLTLYLAAFAVWKVCYRLWARSGLTFRRWIWVPEMALLVVSVVLLAVFTRPVAEPPDPASPAVPSVGLYAVAMSGQSEQADLEAAVRAADAAAAPGTAMLLLGSALSWHQPLWAPLWTTRPLYYDNWLWYWQPHHAGTPGYVFQAGNHYPDPERTLDASYLARHGIGAVLVTGPVRVVAAASPLLWPIRHGVYDAYAVIDPVTTVTFGAEDSASAQFGNQRITAQAASPASPVMIRQNWYPRWQATADGRPALVAATGDASMQLALDQAASQVELVYAVQPIDWAARALALAGATAAIWLAVRSVFGRRWYAQWSREANATARR